MNLRYYYSDSIQEFLRSEIESIFGKLSLQNEFSLVQEQKDAWMEQIHLLKLILKEKKGKIYFEYSIPRMGKRIDVVLIIRSMILVLEFKVGEKVYHSHSIDQVFDYALDLKNFHEMSHTSFIAPILISTKAPTESFHISLTPHNDKLLFPIRCNENNLGNAIDEVIEFCKESPIDSELWEKSRYSPSPTIVEAAMALYSGHSVEEISRNDASAINLAKTSQTISDLIKIAKDESKKIICFVTGVPEAGKTLVGLNIATENIDKESDLHSVFLSGNGPLVDILREALTRDKFKKDKELGKKTKKGEIKSQVKMFIQNVHHFRDDCLKDMENPPIEHVAIFDEAQRAWNYHQTVSFMKQKRNQPDFDFSEPEFLISCLNRHEDWAVVVCLVGGGQEINTGEAGIQEWIVSVMRTFPDWHLYMSSQLTDSEYNAGSILEKVKSFPKYEYKDELHLSVSLRSYRAENVSLLVKQVLDLEMKNAQETLSKIKKFPIVLTRDLQKAKDWLKRQARGSERYGMVASSKAERLKPHAIHVKTPIDPIHWFLDGKDDIRSSYYLEDVATEYKVQGLELDWVCVTWDGDFRFNQNTWEHWAFVGSRWNKIHKPERQVYLKNAYRVLLTRARQGMVVFIPEGVEEDPTRNAGFYDPTFEYLREVGFEVI